MTTSVVLRDVVQKITDKVILCRIPDDRLLKQVVVQSCLE